jgi:hypothetical protein
MKSKLSIPLNDFQKWIRDESMNSVNSGNRIERPINLAIRNKKAWASHSQLAPGHFYADREQSNN